MTRNSGNTEPVYKGRAHVCIMHPVGTGACNVVANILVGWISWLCLLAKFNDSLADLWSKLIRFELVNTNEEDLARARRVINKRLQQAEQAGYEFPNLIINANKVLDYGITGGDGCANKAEGKKVMKEYRAEALALALQCYFYIPVTTLGVGSTGSSACVMLALVGLKAQCQTFPFVILSAAKEMDKAAARFQRTQKNKLMKLPVYVFMGDNGYFMDPSDLWNYQMSQTEAFGRMNHVFMNALRVVMMMLIVRNQMDKRKLMSFLGGYGGLLSVAGTTINQSTNNVAQEMARAFKLCYDTPLGLEIFQREDPNQRYHPDVIVTGFLGG